METVPPYNNYQSPPPGPQFAHQPGQVPPEQQHHAHYPQAPPGQTPIQHYAPAQHPQYQSPPGPLVNQIPQAQAHYSQSPQGQYPPAQQQIPGPQPVYQSPAPGHPVHQSPQLQQHPGLPQQHAPNQQPSYQSPQYGVAAPPTPAQHQQQYQQQAAQFAKPAQLQSTAQSLYKSGKGFLGNLASNIKNKYPANSSAPATSSTTSYTGEAPKPTYNPEQHPTQTPLSPTNSFPQGFGQQGYPQHAPPTPQQSVSPGASGYHPTVAHQASFPSQSQGIPGQPQIGQYAPQQLHHQSQPSVNGVAVPPGAIPQQAVQLTAPPYPQHVLHHQQSNPYAPTAPVQSPQAVHSPGQGVAQSAYGQGPPQVLPQQQYSPAAQVHPQVSSPQQIVPGAPYNPAVATTSLQSTAQPTYQAGPPSHGPPGMYQQTQNQPGAPVLDGPTASPHAAQLTSTPGAPYGQVQNPSKPLSPSQQHLQSSLHQSQQPSQQGPPAQQHGQYAVPPTQPVSQSVSHQIAQTGPVNHAPQGLPSTQSPHQQHSIPPNQQLPTGAPMTHAQYAPPHGHHYSPSHGQPPSTMGAPAPVQQAGTPGQNYSSLPSSPPLQNLNQPSSILPSAPTAGQFQPYSPSTLQEPPPPPPAQYGHPAANANPQHYPQTSPSTQEDHTSPAQFVPAPAPGAAGPPIQPYQPYQPAQQSPHAPQPPPVNGQPAADGHHQDPVDSLSTQMHSLNVHNEHQHQPAPNTHLIHGQDGPRGPAPCQATGMVIDTLPYCPENRVVTYALDWYRLAVSPQYLICTRCYADHVAGTHLAGHFERYHSPEGTDSKCGFWSPRAREVIWPQALQTNDIGHLRAFADKSLAAPDCKGRVLSTAADGVKWWGMVNNEVDGFISCDACYEDRIAGTSFQSRFSPYRQQGPEEKWMCDLCIPYLSTAIVKMSKQDHWSGFVEAVKARIHLPVCEGRDEESNNGHWILPRRRIENMTICEACYLDKLALTPFGNEFERHARAEGFDAFLNSLGQKWKCSMTDTAVNMSIALEAAIYRRDFEVFWNAANAICGLVPCTANGIVGGKWWTVAGGCPDLDVCEACYKGILETSNLERFFEPAPRDPAATIVCNFCPASPRWGMFITKFAEAMDKGVFSYYTDYVKRWAGVPTCPGIRNKGKSKWWGHPEALACEDCWLNFVADTPLGPTVPVKGVYDERTLICQLWSPRMRNMWLAACAAGPPGSPESEKALDEFRAFGTKRVQVYNATIPHIEMIEQMMIMKRMQAMQQGQLSLMYQGMNSTSSIMGTTDGNLHGNSSVGYYETEHGVTAANMMNNMHAGMADANKMSDWMQIAQLKAAWMEVE
ncbi:hypothetical protein NW752_002455 [Fusarium irregulare]|uniref:Integral membrane protein n=1 Tax=Fusarium irregulare TaxID=2494466 RepID=A0A9W8U6D6_9HYPO|nr:hypothetical protein NW766_011172 [Fusarium irregulare]KAJ4024999.1 hypothetical protein NW752_002455 [Fusarium irregulare]